MDMIVDNTTTKLPPQTKRQRRTRNDWRTLIEAWACSGQTQRAFCQERELCYRQFSQWKSRFKTQHAEDPDADVPTFVPVHVKPSGEETTQAMQIVLPNGIRLENICKRHLPILPGVAEALMTLSC